MKQIFNLFAFTCILSISLPISANTDGLITIRGRIVDKTKQAIPFSTVHIVTPQNPFSIVKGVASDNNGEFSLLAAKNSAYILHARFLGYKNQAIEIKTDSIGLELGDIILETETFALSEITVRPSLEVTADKIIYRFEDDPVRERSNLFDMLEKMPLVSVSPAGKIIVGSEDKTYIVLRKGCEDALFSFRNVKFEELIKKLPAMGFTTFEIWTVVPPKFSQYDYVINILPDPTQRLFGATTSPEAFYSFGHGESRVGLGSNGSANIFRFSGGVKYEDSDAPKGTRETMTMFHETVSEHESLFKQKETNNNESTAWQVNLSASLDISKQQFITLELNTNFKDLENRRSTRTENITNESISPESLGEYVAKYTSNAWSIGAIYQLDFCKKNRIFNVSYLYSSAPSQGYNSREINNITRNENKQKESDSTNITSKTHRVQFDYYDLFFGEKIRFNTRIGTLIINHDNKSVTIDNLTGTECINRYRRLRQNLNRIDGFVNFSYNINRQVNINTVLSIDYLLKPNATKATTGVFTEQIRQERLLLSPEARIFWQFRIPESSKGKVKTFDEMTPDEQVAYITKNMAAGKSFQEITSNSSSIVPNSSIKLDYLYTKRRPGISQLTNYEDERDPLYIRRGNPTLRPESYHFLMMRFGSWFINSFFVNFSFSNDKIVPQTRKEGNKIIQSYYNSGKTRDYRVGFFHTFFKNTISISPLFQNSYINYGDGNWSQEQQVSINIQYNLKLYKNCNSTLGARYYNTHCSGSIGQKDIMPLELSIETIWTPQIFESKAFIIFGMNDILRWNRHIKHHINMPEYRQSTETKHSGIPLYISIRATFGKFKVKPVKMGKSTISIGGFSTDDE